MVTLLYTVPRGRSCPIFLLPCIAAPLNPNIEGYSKLSNIGDLKGGGLFCLSETPHSYVLYYISNSPYAHNKVQITQA